MWRMMPRLAIATLLATLAPAAHRAEASAVQSFDYSTSGSGPATSGPISFQGISPAYNYYGYYGYGYNSATLTTPGAFSLGTFTANTLPTTATLTYDTPFSIALEVASQPTSVTSASPYSYVPNYQYLIAGKLVGSITGGGVSNMFVELDSITGIGSTPPFPISDLTILGPQAIAAPSGSYAGTTSLMAYINPDGTGIGLPSPAPEPASIAILGAGALGWALRRRLQARG